MKERVDVRITCVSKSMRQELKNLADHHCQPVSTFLKPQLRKILDSFPEHLRKTNNSKD